MIYRFIEEHRSEFRVSEMCRVLQIAPSGFYRWLKAPIGIRKRQDKTLKKKVVSEFTLSKKRYGAKRLAARLRLKGTSCSERRVSRLMREEGLKPLRRTKFKKTTNSNHSRGFSPNLLEQNFFVGAPDTVWTGDMAYIKTAQGFLYLAIVLDLYSRKVVGWSISTRMTDQLVIDALGSAFWSRKPLSGVIFHSDRGSQYCSKKFRNNLKSMGFIQSMSSTGNCYDNAITETVFKSMRAELTYHCNFRTRREAKAAIFEYYEIFYNRKRAHSALGYHTPEEFENIFKYVIGKSA